ncbi:MAG TPA: hypothetical protein VHT91_44780 [Kofleriaceae bacterium]|nr:hypothetical protein [Kofleriaceae bacterium]
MRLPMLGLVFLLACGSSHSASDAGPGDGASGDGSSGAACGGPGHACAATEYCDYADNGCGVGALTGTCKARPDVCPVSATGTTPGIVATPTCACDGNIYSNECDANRAGFDVNAHGTCDVRTGVFACGTTQCLVATQYCRRQPHTTGPDTFNCLALPAGCTTSGGCACLSTQPCGNTCAGTSAAGMTLTCAPTS